MKPAENFNAGDDAADDAAAAWVCERAEGFTPERARAFAAWCDRDPRHAAAVARVERALTLLDEMPSVREALEAGVDGVPPAAATAPRGRLLRFPSWLTAGIAAMLVLAVTAWWMFASPAPDRERYATDAGMQRRVALRDGSVLDLNAASDVRVHLMTHERRVTLAAGEAHFQVAHDATRPFIVSAGGVSVRAVGTAFDVRLAAGSVEVIVVEGKVEVTREALSSPTASGVPPQLVAGERTVVSRDRAAEPPAVEKVAPAALRARLAWQDPMTTFTDAPLREVVAQFNRRNTVRLTLEDAAIGERKVGGVVDLGQVEAFVRLLEQDGDVLSEPRGENEIVLRRAR